MKGVHHNLHEPEVTDSKPKDFSCTIMKSQEKQGMLAFNKKELAILKEIL